MSRGKDGVLSCCQSSIVWTQRNRAHLCSEKAGDREVQRTMLELLNQLDGFQSDTRIKVWMGPCGFQLDVPNTNSIVNVRGPLGTKCQFSCNCTYHAW
jgi:hypothetical protein